MVTQSNTIKLRKERFPHIDVNIYSGSKIDFTPLFPFFSERRENPTPFCNGHCEGYYRGNLLEMGITCPYSLGKVLSLTSTCQDTYTPLTKLKRGGLNPLISDKTGEIFLEVSNETI